MQRKTGKLTEKLWKWQWLWWGFYCEGCCCSCSCCCLLSLLLLLLPLFSSSNFSLKVNDRLFRIHERALKIMYEDSSTTFEIWWTFEKKWVCRYSIHHRNVKCFEVKHDLWSWVNEMLYIRVLLYSSGSRIFHWSDETKRQFPTPC